MSHPRSARALGLPRALVAAAATLLALIAASAPASAQDRWYTVEIVVFEQRGDEGLGAEAWSIDPGRPPIEESIRLSRADELPLGPEGEGGADTPHAFRVLEGRALGLEGVRRALRRSGAYRPLLHLAWHQPGFRRREARWAHVHTQGTVASSSPDPYVATASADGGPRRIVDGAVRLRVSRFLHVDVDLLYHRPRSGPHALFRLATTRKLKLGEIHYLDHPVFGAIVQVRRFSGSSDEG